MSRDTFAIIGLMLLWTGLIVLAFGCSAPPAPKPPAHPTPTVQAPPPSYGRKIVEAPRYDPAPEATTTASVRAARSVLDALEIDAGAE